MGTDRFLPFPFLSPQITHQENHTGKTGERKENGEERPGAASAASGRSTTPLGLTGLAHSPGPRPSLRLTRPQPRAAVSAPASVKACAPAATPTPRGTAHRARDPWYPLHLPESFLLLRLLPTGSSSPQRPGVSAASTTRPAPAGIGACAQEPYCVTAAYQLRFRTVSGRVYLSLQIRRDRNEQYF